MAPISYVWFDLGYTLVHLNREKMYQTYIEDHGFYRSLYEIEKAFHITDKYFMRKYPGVLGKTKNHYLPWYYGTLNYHLNLSFDLVHQMNSLSEYKHTQKGWTCFSFTREVLQELKSASINIGLISNWDETARDVLEKNRIIDYFDTIVISSEVGVNKPNAEIFEIGLKNANVNAEECLYVGDNYYDDVIGSKKVNMKAALINPYGGLGINEITHPLIIESIKEIPSIVTNKEGLKQ
ncbi:HAD family hydrolase [Pontibacillus litoralis]|uniref:Haloacid dehalogenase n=1 Tax=Pontibacillus litoralis JSM 072002 TaxID=1385512 RepID=A0A0A5G3K5_9BACI|nr:HAD family hydrolase [Pontibacillus litoralis]KGX86614.1 haloacid dehalogenase [Pontibacillus litoralis JSM 072002]